MPEPTLALSSAWQEPLPAVDALKWLRSYFEEVAARIRARADPYSAPAWHPEQRVW